MRPLAWPVTLDTHGMATIAPEEAPRQRAGLLVATRFGERPDAPSFGLTDQLGQLTIPIGGIEAAIVRFDPGVRVNVLGESNGGRGDILVEVTP